MGFRSIGELAGTVMQRVEKERAAAENRASLDETPADRDREKHDRPAIAASVEGDAPRMGKIKRPTRSRDGWVVRPPLKKSPDPKAGEVDRTGAERTGEPSPLTRPVLTVVKCGPTRPQSSRSPSVGVGPHLVTIDGARVHAFTEALFFGAGARSAILRN